MANNNNQTVTETDIFQQQKKTIETLYDVLQRQQTVQPQYVYSTAVPVTKSTPNYLLFIGGAVLLFLLFKK